MKILILFLVSFVTMLSAQNVHFEKIDSLHNSTIPDDSLYTLYNVWNDFEQPDATDRFIQNTNTIEDSLQAPFVYYIPPDYDKTEKTPLLVYLHGGVNRVDFVESTLEYAPQNPFSEIARENNWFLLFPFANRNCMWWDEPGRQNIKQQIKFLKQNYNIDDDRVFITGVSDGGSGSFHFALTDPDLFASFYPLIGMLSVGNIEAGKSIFLPNLQNRNIYAINNSDDRLYPSIQMRKIIDISLQAGADLLYKEYHDYGHNIDYIQQELPVLVNIMKNNPRNILHSNIYWETAERQFNKCDWLRIDEIDTLRTKQSWQIKYNTELENRRMVFGFISAQNYDGYGTRIENVLDGHPAKEMGLQIDDVIIAMDGKRAKNIDELLVMRNAKQRGDDFSLTVKRAGEEKTLHGKFPEVETYEAIQYFNASGAVKATYFGNEFRLHTSRVAKLTIFIHPAMINLQNPVTVIVNGKVVFKDTVAIDRDFLTTQFKEFFDRTALWVNKLTFEIDDQF